MEQKMITKNQLHRSMQKTGTLVAQVAEAAAQDIAVMQDAIEQKQNAADAITMEQVQQVLSTLNNHLPYIRVFDENALVYDTSTSGKLVIPQSEHKKDFTQRPPVALLFIHKNSSYYGLTTCLSLPELTWENVEGFGGDISSWYWTEFNKTDSAITIKGTIFEKRSGTYRNFSGVTGILVIF